MNPGIITLVSGRTIDLTRLSLTDYSLPAVAQALSHIVRWGGHSQRPIRVAALVQLCGGSPTDTLVALHHDDTEAFGLGDVCHPLKQLFPALQQWEAAVWAECIAPALDLPIEIPEIVHQADRAIGEFEQVQRRTVAGCAAMVMRQPVATAYTDIHHVLRHHGHSAVLETYARDLRLTPEMLLQPTPSYA
jgi:hypothetical protein